MKKIGIIIAIVVMALVFFFRASQQEAKPVVEEVIAVIEIPAGTNHKVEVNKETGEFEVEIRDGKKRVVNFLPYPGNYGFIENTYMDPEEGGDGDALDVLVIAESVPTATKMKVLPIALMELMDKGEIDNKLLAVPVEEAKRVVNVSTYQELLENFPAVKNIIEQWFLNYKGTGVMELKSWQDEQMALQEIEQWRIEK